MSAITATTARRRAWWGCPAQPAHRSGPVYVVDEHGLVDRAVHDSRRGCGHEHPAAADAATVVHSGDAADDQNTDLQSRRFVAEDAADTVADRIADLVASAIEQDHRICAHADDLDRAELTDRIADHIEDPSLPLGVDGTPWTVYALPSGELAAWAPHRWETDDIIEVVQSRRDGSTA